MAIKQERVSGWNVFEDKKGKVVYYNFLTRKAYLLRNSDDKEFEKWNRRYLIGLMVFAFGSLLMMMMGMDLMLAWGLAFLAGVIVWLVMAYFFYFRFLPTLPVVDNFVRPKEATFLNRQAYTNTRGALITQAVISVMIIVLSIINILNRPADLTFPMQMMNYLILIVGIGMLVFAILVMIRRNKLGLDAKAKEEKKEEKK